MGAKTAWINIAMLLLVGGVDPVGAQEASVDEEFQELLTRDDAIRSKIDTWIQDHSAIRSGEGYDLAAATLGARIEEQLDRIEREYERFIRRHPEHAGGRLAYGSFLNDRGESEQAKEEWEKARELDPENPAVWNNLGNYYGETGQAERAFRHYEKAIELDPEQALYYQNLGNVLSLSLEEAEAYYGLDRQEVYRRILDLFEKARRRDPENFPLATDLARVYYGIEPRRPDRAIEAWREALKLAGDAIERQGVYIHLARWHWISGDRQKAQAFLDRVEHEMYSELKGEIRDRMDEAPPGKADGVER